MGRGKVELKKIENPTSRQVTFSKRRNGMLKKAFELSILCDAEVALIVYSPSGKTYQFASHDMQRTIARYRSEAGLTKTSNKYSSSMQYWKNEYEELIRSIGALETRQKNFTGEDLSSLSIGELKQLERQLIAGIERIRSKKRRILSEHITTLRRRHKTLQEENIYLQKEINFNELLESDFSSRAMMLDACNAFYRHACYDVWPSRGHLG